MAEPDSPRTPEPPGDKKASGNNQDLWRLLGLGIQLAATVGLFAALGWWLEEHRGWPAWSRMSISVFGVIAGLYYFVKEALR